MSYSLLPRHLCFYFCTCHIVLCYFRLCSKLSEGIDHTSVPHSIHSPQWLVLNRCLMNIWMKGWLWDITHPASPQAFGTRVPNIYRTRNEFTTFRILSTLFQDFCSPDYVIPNIVSFACLFKFPLSFNSLGILFCSIWVFWKFNHILPGTGPWSNWLMLTQWGIDSEFTHSCVVSPFPEALDRGRTTNPKGWIVFSSPFLYQCICSTCLPLPPHVILSLGTYIWGGAQIYFTDTLK